MSVDIVRQMPSYSLWDFGGAVFEQFAEELHKCTEGFNGNLTFIVLEIRNSAAIFMLSENDRKNLFNQLLCVVSEILTLHGCGGIYLYRADANRFLICYTQEEYLGDTHDVLIADKILQRVQSDCKTADGEKVYLSLSLGIDNTPKSELKLHSVLQNALIASQYSKQNSWCFYKNIASESMKSYEEEIKKLAYFHDVIRDDKLRLAFQPVISTTAFGVCSYESLLRIIETDGSIKSAGEYILLAEKMGFIETVDHIVLELVMKELVMNEHVRLGVNVSSASAEGTRWIKRLMEICKAHPGVAQRVIVELTETGEIKDIGVVAKFVEDLQVLGCTIAIDDFGSGYTSFSYIKTLNPDIIKIDGMFIQNIENCDKNKIFVKMIVEFAKSFGMKTVAEAVENGMAAKELLNLGVDYMQGYYFSEATVNRPWIIEDLKG